MPSQVSLPPRVVGLTGPNAAGKGEVAAFLRSRGYGYHSLSDVVREEASAKGLDHSRENLIQVGNEMRARSGPGALAERVVLKLDRAPSVVDSIRSPYEVEVLRRVPGFLLLGVDAPIALRFERSRTRGRMGDGATAGEFARKEALENSTDPAAQQLARTFELADIVIVNDGTLDELRAKVAAALRIG